MYPKTCMELEYSSMRLPMAMREPCGIVPSSKRLGDFEMECCRRRELFVDDEPWDDEPAAEPGGGATWEDHASA